MPLTRDKRHEVGKSLGCSQVEGVVAEKPSIAHFFEIAYADDPVGILNAIGWLVGSLVGSGWFT